MKQIRKLELHWMNYLSILGLFVCLFMIYVGYSNGLFESRESFVQFVKQFGVLSIVVFISIQIITVLFPVLPTAVTCTAGVIIFGPVEGVLYSYIGIVIGSFAAFFFVRHYGTRMVKKMIGERRFNKYSKRINNGKKFDRVFATVIFLPIGPDNIFVYLAGTTEITLKKFAAIILLGKPIPIALYSLGWTVIINWLNFF